MLGAPGERPAQVLAFGIQLRQPFCIALHLARIVARPQVRQVGAMVRRSQRDDTRHMRGPEAAQKEIRRRAPHTCDVCPTVQEFGSAEDLALHVQLVHTAPTVDDDGNAVGEGAGGDAPAGRKGRNAAADAPAEPSAAK